VIGNPGDTIPTHYLLVSVAFMGGMVFRQDTGFWWRKRTLYKMIGIVTVRMD